MSAPLYIKKGDLVTLTATITERDGGDAVSLAAATITFYFKRTHDETGAVVSETALSRTGALVDSGTGGQCSYTLLAADWTTLGDKLLSGQHDVEVKAVYSASSQRISPSKAYMKLVVSEDLAA